jgi:hypothetical protein
MPREPLDADLDSLAKWEKLPQNEPSRYALPPMTGGIRLAFAFLIILAILVVVGLLQGRLP